MQETPSDIQVSQDQAPESQPKWDYTSNKQNMITGGLVLGGNLLLLVAFLLYQYVPAAHEFISARPL